MRFKPAAVTSVTVALSAIFIGAAVAADSGPGFLAEPDVRQLQAALQAHRTTVSAVAQHYLQRINALDVHGPALHAIIQVNPDAAALAAKLDAAAKGQSTIPVGLSVPIASLPSGSYQFEVTAVDAAGKTAKRTVNFEIK